MTSRHVPAVTWPYGIPMPGRVEVGAMHLMFRHGPCTCSCEGCQSNRDHCYNASSGCLLCANC